MELETSNLVGRLTVAGAVNL